jgi:hypothetical protein
MAFSAIVVIAAFSNGDYMSAFSHFDEDALEDLLRGIDPKTYKRYRLVGRAAWGIVLTGIVPLILLFSDERLWLWGIFYFILCCTLAFVLSRFSRRYLRRARSEYFRRTADAEQVGNKIMLGDGATLISGSILINSVNKYEQKNPELAQALKIIGGLIEKSANSEAANVYNEFNKRLQAGEKG